MENYKKEFQKIAEKFSLENVSREDIEKLQDIMDKLENINMEKSEDMDILISIYSLLQYHEKAYKTFAQVYDKKNKKERNLLSCLRENSDRYKDRLAIRKNSSISRSFIGNMPKFKYFPNPIKNKAFTVGGEAVCDCCEETVDVYYEGSFYSTEDVECLCPECIYSGRAAEKFDGEFQEGLFNDENVTHKEYEDEILHRTPSYMSWQPNSWPAHCDDYCEFLGYAGWGELETLGAENDFENLTGFDMEELKENLQPRGYISGYLFRCLKCGKYCLCADCD